MRTSSRLARTPCGLSDRTERNLCANRFSFALKTYAAACNGCSSPRFSSKRLNLRDFATSIRYRITGVRVEQTFAYYQNPGNFFPDRYRRCCASDRRPADKSICATPIRAASNPENSHRIEWRTIPAAFITDIPFPQAAALCRTRARSFQGAPLQIKLRRDPTFPGLHLLGNDNVLAPCFAGCTKEEYDVEVQRLVAFLETGGASLR